MHCMIDLETMGLRPTSCIVSIGAVLFNEEDILAEFHTAISLQSSRAFGLTTDKSTVDWWMKQSAEARSSWQREDAPGLTESLALFCEWLRSNKATESNLKPWGNGADFDLVLLKSSFDAVNADVPWKFWNHRCFRTVKNLYPGIQVPRQGTHHNALDDARYQTQHLQAICAATGLKLN